MKLNKLTLIIVAVLAVIVVLTVVFGVLEHNFFSGFRISASALYLLFLPGFMLGLVFFPLDERSISLLERLALSLALSIAVVPLFVFFLNLVGLRISILSVILAAGALIVIFGILAFWRTKRSVPIHKIHRA